MRKSTEISCTSVSGRQESPGNDSMGSGGVLDGSLRFQGLIPGGLEGLLRSLRRCEELFGKTTSHRGHEEDLKV